YLFWNYFSFPVVRFCLSLGPEWLLGRCFHTNFQKPFCFGGPSISSSPLCSKCPRTHKPARLLAGLQPWTGVRMALSQQCFSTWVSKFGNCKICGL
uniref:Uncharacterized protein n=1 Tax=Pseudonaja textilis TaxID=8673 RepID=A0A670Z8R2_PSETE